MNDLATIKKQNRPAESKKIRRRARAMNAGCKGHAKAYEKTGTRTGRLNTRVNVQAIKKTVRPLEWRITEPYLFLGDFSGDLI